MKELDFYLDVCSSISVGEDFTSPTPTVCLLSSFLFSNTGAELESQPTDSHILAQCLHAGGLPEGDRRAAHPQIPTGYLHTDRRGSACVLTNELIYHLNSSLKLL